MKSPVPTVETTTLGGACLKCPNDREPSRSNETPGAQGGARQGEMQNLEEFGRKEKGDQGIKGSEDELDGGMALKKSEEVTWWQKMGYIRHRQM